MPGLHASDESSSATAGEFVHVKRIAVPTAPQETPMSRLDQQSVVLKPTAPAKLKRAVRNSGSALAMDFIVHIVEEHTITNSVSGQLQTLVSIPAESPVQHPALASLHAQRSRDAVREGIRRERLDSDFQAFSETEE